MNESLRPAKAQSPWLERLRALQNVPPVLHILWESGPWVVTWGLILRLFVATMPFGIAKVAQYIINGIENAIRGQKLAENFWILVGIEVAPQRRHGAVDAVDRLHRRSAGESLHAACERARDGSGGASRPDYV